MPDYPRERVKTHIQVALSELMIETEHLISQMAHQVVTQIERGIPRREAERRVMAQWKSGEGFAKIWQNRQNRIINQMTKKYVAQPVEYQARQQRDVDYAWVLGVVKTTHCSDCPALAAMTPRTVDEWLAEGKGLPRWGETECSVGCQCMLQAVGKSTPDQVKARRETMTKQAAAAEILAATKNKREMCIALDAEGRVLLKKTGKVDHIEFNLGELRLLKGADFFIHNHPSSSSLSPHDVFFAFDHRIREVAAASPKSFYGDVEYFVRPTEFKNREQFLGSLAVEIRKADIEVRERFWQQIDAKQLSFDEASLRHWDEVWKIVSEKIGFEYGHRSKTN